jgi:hypothetical protein
MSLVRSGSYTEAIDAFSQAIRLNPRDAEAYLYRGRAYQCRNQPGDLDAAIGDFSQAIRFNPDDSEAYYSRAIAYRDRGAATHSKEDALYSQRDDRKARRLDSQLGPENFERAEPDAPLPPVTPLPVSTTSSTTTETEAAADTEKAADSKGEQAAEPRESAADVVRRLESEAASIKNDLHGGDRRRTESATGGMPRSMSRDEPGAAGAARTQRRAEPHRDAYPPLVEEDLARRRSLEGVLPPVETTEQVRPITEYEVPRKSAADRASRYSRPSYAAGGAAPQVPGAESAVVPPAQRNRSPFPQRPPNPTGFNRTQPVEGASPQRRPFYTTPNLYRDDLR